MAYHEYDTLFNLTFSPEQRNQNFSAF